MTFPSRPRTEPTTAGRIRDRLGIVADAGYQPLSNMLLFHQVELGLRSEDLNVLLHVMAHWYEPDSWPFPKAQTIATRMGVSERSVHRSLSRMRERGLMRKVKGGANMAYRIGYDLTPLVEKLTVFAKNKITAKKAA
ncbi:MAG: helix-turn-helix domain-containing protein [Xanthobacteraceae bacterium]